MNFKHGDFVYGLHEYRSETVNNLREDIKEGALVVDGLNYLQTAYKFRVTTPKQVEERTSALVEEKILVKKDSNRMNEYMKFVLFKKETLDDNWWTVAFASEQRWLARSCKAWIRMTALLGTKIHFILDGIDMNDVVDKEREHYTAFTSIELRSAFKYNLCLRSSIDPYINFYKGGEKVGPPWEDQPGVLNGLWAGYLLKKQ